MKNFLACYIKLILDTMAAPYGKRAEQIVDVPCNEPMLNAPYRCFSPLCDCDFQPGSCRGMPRKPTLPQPRWRAKRPIGKHPALAWPYGSKLTKSGYCFDWTPNDLKCDEHREKSA